MFETTNGEQFKREVDFIVSLKDAAEDLASGNRDPFSEETILSNLKKRILLWIGRLVELVIGSPLFVKKFGDEFDFVDIRVKKLIYRLLGEGIIKDFKFLKPDINWPEIIYASASLEAVKTPSGRMKLLSGTAGGACAFDYNSAAKRALAEVLERYSLCVYDPSQIVRGSFDKLKNRGAVDIKKFKCFSDKQLADPTCRRDNYFDNESLFGWVEALSLFGSKKHLVPAQLVFLFYEKPETEPFIRKISTSGAAAGSTWEMAAHNAICETVERDAFMIFWLNKLAPPKVDLSYLINKNPTLHKLYQQCQRSGLEISVLDITTDIGIPTFLAVLIDRADGRYPVKIGARSDFDIEKAITGAIFESLSAGIIESPQEKDIQSVRDKASDIRTIEERRLFWADRRSLREIEFLLSGEDKKIEKNDFSGAGYKDKLKEIKKIFASKNIEIYLVDAASSTARNSGLTVLMSLIPDFYPLYLDERSKYLGVNRLYWAPVRMGYLKYPQKEEEMNTFPHPFL